MKITLELNAEIEKYKVAETFYCTFRGYDLTAKSSVNFDEAETKLVEKIFKFIELNIWNQDLELKININYK